MLTWAWSGKPASHRHVFKRFPAIAYIDLRLIQLASYLSALSRPMHHRITFLFSGFRYLPLRQQSHPLHFLSLVESKYAPTEPSLKYKTLSKLTGMIVHHAHPLDNPPVRISCAHPPRPLCPFC